jgi:hypothetical protein
MHSSTVASLIAYMHIVRVKFKYLMIIQSYMVQFQHSNRKHGKLIPSDQKENIFIENITESAHATLVPGDRKEFAAHK